MDKKAGAVQIQAYVDGRKNVKSGSFSLFLQKKVVMKV